MSIDLKAARFDSLTGTKKNMYLAVANILFAPTATRKKRESLPRSLSTMKNC